MSPLSSHPDDLKRFLRREIEAKAGFRPVTAPDFARLSQAIADDTHERVSPTTLKRIFGYIEGWQQPRPGVLNILATYLGYPNAHTMRVGAGLVPSELSGQITAPHLRSQLLPVDQRVLLTWYPDRRVVVRHLSENLFAVEEVNGSHVAVGATFCCDVIVEGQPLTMQRYLAAGNEGEPVTYECGRRGGVQFELL